MAGGQERALRRRIRSVDNTRKITKAMELIAASQISRAQARIAANRPYRDGMRRVILEAAQGDPVAAKKLLTQPETVRRVAVLVLTGDRGLSGSYNANSLRAGERLVRDLGARGVEVRLYCVGKKAGPFYRYRNIEVTETFQGFTDKPTFAHAREVAATVAAPFIDGEVDQVLMVSTVFHSSASQSVETATLLPLSVPEAPAEGTTGRLTGYTEFEPDAQELLFFLAPRALESEIFTALLDGAASFHISQQRAMAAATDNAEELALNLKRIMNRARQDSITTEIMEIVGGAEALRSGK